MYFLSISTLPNNIYTAFMQMHIDIELIYIVSPNLPLLQNFKEKILSFTNPEYIPFIRIEILPLSSLREDEYELNNLHLPYEIDKIYLYGIINSRGGSGLSYEEFTPEVWDF